MGDSLKASLTIYTLDTSLRRLPRS